MLFNDIRQHQLGCGPGVFFNTAAQERHPLVLLIKLLIAGLQHFQRFADQLFVLIDNTKQALHGFGVIAVSHKDPAHHNRDAGAVAIGRGAFL